MQTTLRSTVRRYTCLFNHGTNVYSSYALLRIRIRLDRTLNMVNFLLAVWCGVVRCERRGTIRRLEAAHAYANTDRRVNIPRAASVHRRHGHPAQTSD
jgi:hypothetical protein